MGLLEYVANPNNHEILKSLEKADIDNYDLLGIDLKEQIPVTIKELV